jgi:uncharacterized protein
MALQTFAATTLGNVWRAALRAGGVLAALLASLWLSLPATAQTLQPVPALQARVTDLTDTLSAMQREALEGKLAAFEAQSGPQIVLLLVASTQPEDIAAYAYRVADQWKLGRREVGDGVLLLVAVQDHKVRIEVAKALEGAIPDLAARQIMDRAVKPAFKAGDYAGGLNQAVDQLIGRIQGEGLPEPGPRSAPATQAPGWNQLAMFFFVGVPILGAVLTGVLGRKLGALATGSAAGALAWWISTSLLLSAGAGVLALMLVGVLGIGASGRRGGGGGGLPIIWGSGGGGGGRDSGGNGGFSSGGGGDFGGGGASGDW